jgi:hypothetical protein
LLELLHTDQLLFRGEKEYFDKRCTPRISRNPAKLKNGAPIGAGTHGSMYMLEDRMMDDFINYSKSYDYSLSTFDNWTWLMIAQHYGVPTRLLDWSVNPLVALYFACNDSFDKDGYLYVTKDTVSNIRPRKNADRWTFSDLKINNQESGYVKPNYDQNIRFEHQESVFYYANNEYESAKFDLVIVINKNDKIRIMNILSLYHGIDAAFLMPGLDGIGKFVADKHFQSVEKGKALNVFYAGKGLIAKK